MALEYIIGDELGSWQQPIGGEFEATDFSSGWTFQVTMTPAGSTTASFTKTTGITGGTGSVTVSWATSGELNSLTAGRYEGRLRCRRSSDSRDFTTRETFLIVAAHA